MFTRDEVVSTLNFARQSDNNTDVVVGKITKYGVLWREENESRWINHMYVYSQENGNKTSVM